MASATRSDKKAFERMGLSTEAQRRHFLNLAGTYKPAPAGPIYRFPLSDGSVPIETEEEELARLETDS